MPAKPVKKTSLHLPVDLYWAVKELAVTRRMSDTAAVREALNLWVAAGAYPECTNLVKILQSDTDRGRQFRQKIIPVFRAWNEEQEHEGN
jgi:hypothetical protein